jgi:hypothetical protein
LVLKHTSNSLLLLAQPQELRQVLVPVQLVLELRPVRLGLRLLPPVRPCAAKRPVLR